VSVGRRRQYATFVLDGLLFGIEVGRVREALRHQPLTPVPLTGGAIGGLLNLRGEIVTAFDLRWRLELPARPPDQRPMNLVVRTDDGVLSLLVDEISDVVDVDEDRFELRPETLTGEARDLIRGTFQAGQRLMLVLDLDRALAAPGVLR